MKKKGVIQETTFYSDLKRRMLTFSFCPGDFYVSHSYWTKNREAIVGDMLFHLTPEEALRLAGLIQERYGRPVEVE